MLDPAPVPARAQTVVADDSKTAQRSARRAFDGTPPTIPHGSLGTTCTACHSNTGIQFGQMGYAPPVPHGKRGALGRFTRCQQCHVPAKSKKHFAESDFEGLEQTIKHQPRAHALAPPVIPHAIFMRRNCMACHTGPAGREEIRCTHPERIMCLQCHVEVTHTTLFER